MPNPVATIKAVMMLASVFLAASCGTSVYYVKPPDWREPSARDSTIRAYASVLKGKTIFLDPGHGGDDRGGKGPAGDVVESQVNLRVALALRDYLRKAGANVLLSRETDQTVPLAERARMANANGADLFISIHHNATENPYTNYTCTFYHARPGRPGYKSSSHDLARYIQRDLAYVMGNPGPLVGFDGTLSDELIYPGAGFAVLRETNMTSVLIECAFFTSAYEEQRLRRSEFNEIQAWGIFRGIAKYLRAGVPKLAYASPTVFEEARPRIDIEVVESQGIQDESIRVWIDGNEQGFVFNTRTNRITVTPTEDLPLGYHRISAQVRNLNENSSAPFERFFSIGKPAALLRWSADPPTLPPDMDAVSRVTVTAVDSSGQPVNDGYPLHFRSAGVIDTVLFARNGTVCVELHSGAVSRIPFEVFSGPVETSGSIAVVSTALYTRGLVMSLDGKPVNGAEITLPGGLKAVTDKDGGYHIAGRSTDGVEVVVRAKGYFGRHEALTGQRVQDPIILTPVARGILHNKTVLIDASGYSADSVSGHVAFDAAEAIALLLEASGAIVHNLVGVNASERALIIAHNKGAYLIRFAYRPYATRLAVSINASARARSAAEHVSRSLRDITKVAVSPIVQRVSRRDEITGVAQILVDLPPSGQNRYERRHATHFAWNTAWGVYEGILTAEGYSRSGTRNVEAKIVDNATGAPAAFVLVTLNHALLSMADNQGIVRFRAVTVAEDDVRPVDAERHRVDAVKTEIIP
ncbi:MAG: N-acetylmuramoyl-L-alanine amidase [Bacteroidota bacterium]|nr:N-acetylmuramoyl-L-alanine amidase [Bacteroidota bacterium]